MASSPKSVPAHHGYGKRKRTHSLFEMECKKLFGKDDKEEDQMDVDLATPIPMGDLNCSTEVPASETANLSTKTGCTFSDRVQNLKITSPKAIVTHQDSGICSFSLRESTVSQQSNEQLYNGSISPDHSYAFGNSFSKRQLSTTKSLFSSSLTQSNASNTSLVFSTPKKVARRPSSHSPIRMQSLPATPLPNRKSMHPPRQLLSHNLACGLTPIPKHLKEKENGLGCKVGSRGLVGDILYAGLKNSDYRKTPCNFNPFTPRNKRIQRLRSESNSFQEGCLSPQTPVTRFNNAFEYDRELGRGSFGKVVLCKHKTDGMLYALKIVPKVKSKKVVTEAMILAALSHTNLLRYYDTWNEDQTYYIQTEYCDLGSVGDKLDNFRDKGGRFKENDLLDMCRQVLSALKYLHEDMNLVHMDVKPTNIFIKTKGNEIDESNLCYKLGDYGHVTKVDTADIEEGDSRYMAHELLNRSNSELFPNSSDATKADIFSAGLTFFECATLKILPNSGSEGSGWNDLREKPLPKLVAYSMQLSDMLVSMCLWDHKSRPSAFALLQGPCLSLGNLTGLSHESALEKLILIEKCFQELKHNRMQQGDFSAMMDQALYSS